MSKCDLRNVSVLVYAQGFTQWHYKMPKGLSLKDFFYSQDYFNSCSDMFSRGDIIMGSDEWGNATIASVKHIILDTNGLVELKKMC